MIRTRSQRLQKRKLDRTLRRQTHQGEMHAEGDRYNARIQYMNESILLSVHHSALRTHLVGRSSQVHQGASQRVVAAFGRGNGPVFAVLLQVHGHGKFHAVVVLDRHAYR